LSEIRSVTQQQTNKYVTGWADQNFGPLRLQSSSHIRIVFMDFDPVGPHDQMGTCEWSGLNRAASGTTIRATSCDDGVVTATITVWDAPEAVVVDRRPAACTCLRGRRVEAVCRVTNGEDVPMRVSVNATANTTTLRLPTNGSESVTVAPRTDTEVRVEMLLQGALVGCREATCTCDFGSAERLPP
jgi:hypothetical protein